MLRFSRPEIVDIDRREANVPSIVQLRMHAQFGRHTYLKHGKRRVLQRVGVGTHLQKYVCFASGLMQ